MYSQNHGWVQSVSLLLLEYFVLVSMAITKPYNMRSTNALHISLQVLRVLVQGVLIAFNSNLELNEIIRYVYSLYLEFEWKLIRRYLQSNPRFRNNHHRIPSSSLTLHLSHPRPNFNSSTAQIF